MKDAVLTRAIEAGLFALQGMQQKDGGFPAYASADMLDFKDAVQEPAVFPTALIGRSLAPMAADYPLALRITKRISSHLLREKSAAWSWNYWKRGSGEAKRMPYPDDLDDTAVALAALSAAGAIGGAPLAKILQLMFRVETAPGGPYRTWLVGKKAPKVWQDVDGAVNANIAAFWSLREVALPGVTEHVERSMRRSDYASPYYPSPYTPLYFISLWYRGPEAPRAVRYLLRRRRGGRWATPLTTALALTALLNFGFPPRRLPGAAAWLGKQARSGHWPAEGCYLAPARGGVAHYGGSAALTTAFAIEALLRYREALRKERHAEERAVEEKAKTVIVRSAKRSLAFLPRPLREKVLLRLVAMAGKDRDGSIMLLASRFAVALKKRPKALDTLSRELGAANLPGWAGYDLLDDVWDGDAPPGEIPVADALVREAMRRYERLFEASAERALWHALLGRMDEAARFELAECRADIASGNITAARLPEFGTYATLADRSLPHALGPLLLLRRAGHPPGSPMHRALLSFFRSYLIARQLNDDAHDWEEDLFRGRISPVVAALFRAVRKKTIARDDMPSLRAVFWRRVIFDIAGDIRRALSRARRSLGELRVVADTDHLQSLLAPLDRAATKAVEEARQAQDFMKALKS